MFFVLLFGLGLVADSESGFAVVGCVLLFWYCGG